MATPVAAACVWCRIMTSRPNMRKRNSVQPPSAHEGVARNEAIDTSAEASGQGKGTARDLWAVSSTVCNYILLLYLQIELFYQL